MAESGGNLASTLGGGPATLFLNRAAGRRDMIFLERSSGLPLKVLSGRSNFIVIDGEGAIAWHDSHTGKLLATFRLYQDSWVLEKAERSNQSRNENAEAEREIIRGHLRIQH